VSTSGRCRRGAAEAHEDRADRAEHRVGTLCGEIGFVKPGHEPFVGQAAPAGTYGVVLTIHVDDVDAAYGRAQKMGAEITEEIRDEEYGQRHFLVVDPNGLLLNVMSAI
jgi:catechol 2,3-dioxygenase-like lactoylglutathione lyase family enzyme